MAVVALAPATLAKSSARKSLASNSLVKQLFPMVPVAVADARLVCAARCIVKHTFVESAGVRQIADLVEATKELIKF